MQPSVHNLWPVLNTNCLATKHPHSAVPHKCIRTDSIQHWLASAAVQPSLLSTTPSNGRDAWRPSTIHALLHVSTKFYIETRTEENVDLRFSGTLHSVVWQLVIRVAGQRKVCRGTSVNTNRRFVTSQKSEEHIYTADEAWNNVNKTLMENFRKLNYGLNTAAGWWLISVGIVPYLLCDR